jgi:hypothetical protein
MHPAVIINMLLHGIMSIEPKSELTEGKKKQARWLSDQNIFTNTQAYYIIQVSLSSLLGFSSSSSSNQLITSLYESIQAVKLLTVLTYNSTDDISNGHHADHSLVIYDRNVSDPVVWKKE